MKKIAIDYKGKYFTIQDSDVELDWYDVEDETIDVEKVINDNKLLANHVMQCIYYGIPPYFGNDEELYKRIDEITNNLEEEYGS